MQTILPIPTRLIYTLRIDRYYKGLYYRRGAPSRRIDLAKLTATPIDKFTQK